MNKPLVLNIPGFEDELNEYSDRGLLPLDLTDFLKSIVSAHVYYGQLVETDPDVIKFAKEHLPNGLIIFTSNGKGEGHFDIGVYVPDGDEDKEAWSYFYLIPHRPGTKLKYLMDL